MASGLFRPRNSPVVRQNDIAGEEFKNQQHSDRRSLVSTFGEDAECNNARGERPGNDLCYYRCDQARRADPKRDRPAMAGEVNGLESQRAAFGAFFLPVG